MSTGAGHTGQGRQRCWLCPGIGPGPCSGPRTGSPLGSQEGAELGAGGEPFLDPGEVEREGARATRGGL